MPNTVYILPIALVKHLNCEQGKKEAIITNEQQQTIDKEEADFFRKLGFRPQIWSLR